MGYKEKITELRIDNDYKQSDIAKLLNTTQSNYGKYELGKLKLQIDDLIKLCILYGVSADYILELPQGLKYPKR